MKKYIVLSIYHAGSAIILKTAGFLVSLWMAQALDLTEYGNFGVLFAIQVGVVTFSLAGIFESVIGLLRQCKNVDERHKLFCETNFVFMLTIGSTLVFASAAGVFVYGLKLDIVTFASVLLSGGLLAYAALQSQLIRLDERHIASLAFSFAVPATALVSSCFFFWAVHTAKSFFIGSVIGLVFSLFVLRGIGLFKFEQATNENGYQKELFSRMAPFIAIAFFGWMSGYGNNLVIAKLFDNVDVARFTFAMSIGAIMQLFASALNQVWSPRFYMIVHAEPFNIVEGKNRKFFIVQSLVLGFMGMLLIILLSPALEFIGGNLANYSQMEVEFFLLVAGYIILIPWWHCNNYFLAYDRGRSVMNIVLATSATGITLWLALMWLLGPIGIYIGFFAQMLMRSIGITLIARRLWPIRVSWTSPLAGILLAGAGLFIAKI